LFCICNCFAVAKKLDCNFLPTGGKNSFFVGFWQFFHTEAILANPESNTRDLSWWSCAEWSREMLLEAWIDDPVACCEKCGVVPPSAIMPDYSLQPRDNDAGSAFSLPLPLPQFVVGLLAVLQCVSKNATLFYFLNNSVKNELV